MAVQLAPLAPSASKAWGASCLIRDAKEGAPSKTAGRRLLSGYAPVSRTPRSQGGPPCAADHSPAAQHLQPHGGPGRFAKYGWACWDGVSWTIGPFCFFCHLLGRCEIRPLSVCKALYRHLGQQSFQARCYLSVFRSHPEVDRHAETLPGCRWGLEAPWNVGQDRAGCWPPFRAELGHFVT